MGENLVISLLQYADDTIFFFENTDKTICGIKIILILFQIITGLRVNFKKSCIYTSYSNEGEATSWARTLECPVCKFPFDYVGASIGVN